MSMYNYQDADRYDDRFDVFYHDADDDAEPVCVCPEHFGAKPVWCEACKQWTDETEIQLMDAVDEATERKPVTVERNAHVHEIFRTIINKVGA